MDTQQTQTTPQTISKDQILEALNKHIAQRSGINCRDYYSSWSDKDGRAAFMQDYRGMLKDGRDARHLMRYVSLKSGISADDILRHCTKNDRLSYNAEKNCFEYITGQYFPTEYRSAACRLLVATIRSYYFNQGYKWDQIAKILKGDLGRGIFNRWLS